MPAAFRQQSGRMIGIARAGDDRQVRILAPELAHHPLRGDGLVHGKDDGCRAICAEATESMAMRGIAKGDRVALAQPFADEVCVAVNRDVGLIVPDKHVGDEPADPSEPDDDRVASLHVGVG